MVPPLKPAKISEVLPTADEEKSSSPALGWPQQGPAQEQEGQFDALLEDKPRCDRGWGEGYGRRYYAWKVPCAYAAMQRYEEKPGKQPRDRQEAKTDAHVELDEH